MFFKKKKAVVDQEQHQRLEYAQKRVQQKKGFYNHLVWFAIGIVFLFLINKILKYGQPHSWYIWVSLAWGFLVCIHLFRVFITHKFMGKEWEREQRQLLVEKQEKKIAQIQSEIDQEIPLPTTKQLEE